MRNKVSSVLALACAVAGTAVWAQVRGGGSEWLTANGDAQRTSWIRTDAAISVDAFKTPGFDLQWKSTLVNQPRQLHSLAQGVTVNGVTLFVPMSLVTGSSNNVFAIDNDTGYTVWQRHFDAPLPAATASCPGGITAAATRIVSATPPVVAAGRGAAGGGARGGGYRSAVGEPGAGVPLDNPQRGGAAGRAGAPPAAGAGAPGVAGAAAAAAGDARGGGAAAGAGAGAAAAAAAGRGQIPPGGGGARGGGAGDPGIPGAPAGLPGGGFGRPSGVVYTVSSDGMLHVLGVQTGKDMQKPAPFLPANARWSDLIAVKETLYASTTENCGGAPNGVWSIDLASDAKPVTSWKTNGGGVTGMAFTTDGTLLAAIGKGQAAAGAYANAIVALDPKTLQPKDWFTDASIEFATLPLIFRLSDQEIVAAATKDGRILLLDASSLGGSNHSTPLYASRSFAGNAATFAPEALAMWQEMAPAAGSQAPAAGAATAPPPQGAPPGVPQGPLTTAPVAPGAAGGPPTGSVPPTRPGTTWLLMPIAGTLSADAKLPTANGAVSNGAIVALKVVEAGGKLSLEPGWVSKDLAAPVAPLVVNGVVFAASSGKPQGAVNASAADLARRGTPAVLYALNGADGKELWNSGKTITSFLSARSFWSATGQVYVGTFDGTVYAFGPPMDRK